jgi:hypothetical protein
LQRQEFIIKLGKGLIRAGAPSHRIVSETFFFFFVAEPELFTLWVSDLQFFFLGSCFGTYIQTLGCRW